MSTVPSPTGSDGRAEPAPLMEMTGISKRFDATQALDDVSLTLYPGETHALLGENGAGKSTLIKVMTGIHAPDAGVMRLRGQELTFKGSGDAQRAGIAAIYQEPAIFPDLNVAENIFMSHQDRGALVHWRRMYRDAEAILSRIDVRMDVRRLASGLTVAAQQAVEIAKALSLDVRVLIMDEPTAALSAHEVSELFKQIRHLTDSGVAVLFISHRLDEVFEIADRVTVLRDGRLISSRPKREVTEALAIREMVGREMSDFFARNPQPLGDVVMRVEGLEREGAFYDVGFELREGEVLGFAGLVGAGRTDVGLSLFGIAPPDRGVVELRGKRLSVRSPRRALRAGIAYLSEDRRQLGLSLPQSVTANITLATLRHYVTRLRLLNRAAERAVADRFREKLTIRTPSLDTPVEQLSGGNQQKTMLAKWLNAQPSVLILDEPTRGIDVGAKVEVHHIIDELAGSGMAIILISSDLPEVLAMSDRVLVMREGRQMGLFEHGEVTEERILTAAMGAG
jgi:rhamnose transport system ATP-binding protein